MNDTQKSAQGTAATEKKYEGFTDEERGAMKERAKELKADARRGPRGKKTDEESAVLAKIAEMTESDRADGRAAPCRYQGQCARPLAETLVRDARVCQGRQGRLLLPTRAEVQSEVRDVRLQRRGEPRRRRHVADRLRPD